MSRTEPETGGTTRIDDATFADGLRELPEEYLLLVLGGNGTFTSEQPVAQAGFPWGDFGGNILSSLIWDGVKAVYNSWVGTSDAPPAPDGQDGSGGGGGAVEQTPFSSH